MRQRDCFFSRIFCLLAAGTSFALCFPATMNAAVIVNAEDFDEKTTGADDGGEWLMEESGYLLHNVTFEEDGFYTFDFYLRGQQGDAVYPEIQIDLDEINPLASASVDDKTRKRYCFQSKVTKGVHSIKLTYVNGSPGRQLRVDRIEIDATTLDEESQFLLLADTFMRLVPDPAEFGAMDWRIVNALYGLLRAYQVSGETTYLNYILQWADAHIDSDGNFDEKIDDVFTGGLVLELYLVTEDSRFLQAGMDVKDYLDNDLTRLENGAIVHVGESQLWDDTLFGVVRFFVALARATDDLSVLDEAANQLLLHDAVLRDPESGLWYHGWDQSLSADWADAKTGLSPEFWGRGNGWVIASAVDLLELLPDAHKDREAITAVLREMANGLKLTQHLPSGLWYTLLDKSDEEMNYLEISATSLFVYGIQRALKLELIDPSFAAVAAAANDGLNRAILQKESGDLYATHISQGTNVGGTDYYLARVVGNGFEYMYGHGVFLEAKYATVTASSIPLPVELNGFSGIAIDGKVELSWMTASESGNFGFHILRSKNGLDFIRVGFVKGQWTTNTTQSYHFVDNKVDTGTYHYRLEQIDLDGTAERSPVIRVAVQPPANFRLSQNYPNPFNPSTSIHFDLSHTERVLLELYDMKGRLVKVLLDDVKTAGRHTVEFDAGDLPTGTYIYRLKAGGFEGARRMVYLK